jgi:uracil-DNA glycosylase family 4
MRVEMPLAEAEPSRDCPLCSRLAGCREELRRKEAEWWNAPVPAWGDPRAWLAVVGLAPGLRGANRTGRPFTGDDAGDFLFAALARSGLASGTFDRRADDGFRLNGAMILNAVKCWPPQNKPTPAEIATCRRFLDAQLAALRSARVLLALGRIAHDSLLRRYGLKLAAHPFAHAAEHALPDGRVLLDSYHCSRQNTRTGKLTPAMFDEVIERAKGLSYKMPARAP